MVGFAGGEFFEWVDARGDGDGAGTDRSGTLHVERGVADHPDAVGGVFVVNLAADDLEGFAGDAVAVEMDIAKCTEGETVIQVEVAEFPASSFGEVAGQQAEPDVGLLFERGEQFGNAGQDAAGAICQGRGEAAQVRGAKALPVFGGIFEVVGAQQVAGDGAIGAARHVDFAAERAEVEFRNEGGFEGGTAGTAGG